MKIFLLAVALFSAHFFSLAQTSDSAAANKNCYEEYKAMFKKQGTFELNDGLYNTIITIRLNGACASYEGLARIDNHKFELPILIKDEQGRFIPLKESGRVLNKNYDAYKIPLENKIENGCSPTLISDKDELVDIFLIDLLKPVK